MRGYLTCCRLRIPRLYQSGIELCWWDRGVLLAGWLGRAPPRLHFEGSTIHSSRATGFKIDANKNCLSRPTTAPVFLYTLRAFETLATLEKSLCCIVSSDWSGFLNVVGRGVLFDRIQGMTTSTLVLRCFLSVRVTVWQTITCCSNLPSRHKQDSHLRNYSQGRTTAPCSSY